jgi:predicted transposase YdaD
MPDLTNPHDHFFRDSFGQRELVADFCQHYLPAEVAAMLDADPVAWELRAESFIDETLGGHFSDLLYLTRLFDGMEAYVYLLFEHKSAPEPTIALQLLRYKVGIWERDRRERPGKPLRPILPVVVYHGRRRWRVPLNFAGLMEAPEAWRGFCLDFQYLLIDISRHGPEPVMGEPRLQGRLLALRAAFTRDLVAALVEILDRLERVGEIELQVRDLDTILLYLSATPAGQTPKRVREAMNEAVQTRGGEMVNDWELYKEELRAEGLEQGLERGLRQGIALALEIKFGTAGLALVPAIEQVHDADQLQAVLDSIRDATSPDDVAQRAQMHAG